MFDQLPAKTTQRGAVLITTLVFLVILTLYSVMSARDAKTQLLIASNNQIQTISLATAEGTLTRVENTVDCLRNLPAAPDLLPAAPDPDPTTITHALLNGSVCYDVDVDITGTAPLLSPKDFGDAAISFTNTITVTLDKLIKTCNPDTGVTTREIYKIIVQNNNGRGTKRQIQSYYQTLTDLLTCP